MENEAEKKKNNMEDKVRLFYLYIQSYSLWKWKCEKETYRKSYNKNLIKLLFPIFFSFLTQRFEIVR